MKTARPMFEFNVEAKDGTDPQGRCDGGESGFSENLVGQHQNPSYR